MPRQFSSTYTLVFVAAVGTVCAFLLALAAEGLRPYQQRNMALDKRRNILLAFGVFGQDKPLPAEATMAQIQDFYASNVQAEVVDVNGKVVTDAPVDPTEIDLRLQAKDKPREQWLLPVFKLKDDSGKVVAYTIPIVGQGLWGPIYGYLALKDDADTVLGITFFKHQETPGLGAEIDSAWFQQQFVGKTLWQGDKLVGIGLVKGGVQSRYQDPAKVSHYVDAIGGATKTSEGVTDILTNRLRLYAPWMRHVRGSNGDGNDGR